MPRPSPRFKQAPLEDTLQAGKLAPPPSPLLMDHLWEMFGQRPELPLDMDANPNWCLAVMARQGGIESVLNYLQSLVDSRNPSTEA